MTANYSSSSADPGSGAEDRLQSQASPAQEPTAQAPPVTTEVLRLLHELQVQQIELELQNEELRHSRKALEKEKARYTDYYDFSPMGFVSLDRNGIVVQLNLVAVQMLNRERSHVIGERFESLLARTDQAVFKVSFSLLFAGDARQSFDVALAGRTRRKHTVQIEAALSYDKQECRLVMKDITERKQIQAQLQASHDLLNNLSAQVPGLFYQFQLFPDGRSCFPYASEGIHQVYGVSPQAVSLDATPVFATLHPDDLDRVSKSIERSARTLLPWVDEYRVILPIRGLRWLSGSATPRRQDDGSTLWHGYISDITAKRALQDALRTSEERFRLAMEASNDGLWDWEVANDSNYCSPGYFRMLGYAPEGPMMALKHWSALIHPEDRALVLKHNLDTIENPGHHFELEYRLRASDGSWKWILGRGNAVARDAQGRALRMIGTNVDITERKQAQDALKDAKRDAERANNAKSQFLAAASHDLRQPLAALSLYIEVLKIKPEPPAKELLISMTSCVSSLSELLADLLDISMLDAGVVEPAIGDFAVSDLMAKLVAVHAPTALKKGLRLHCRPSALCARTDRVLLARMMGNILANAVSYTQRGGVLMGCRQHAGKTWIEVWDSGMGIAQEKTGEIFEEYRQLNPSASNRGNAAFGSGLGLAIVAKTAALLGLEIRVHSRLGCGSMFAVELPLADADRVAKRAVGLRETRHKALRIALVEDNIDVLHALGRALKGKGNKVLGASSLPALLSLLGDEAPDVVISDYRLNDGENGFDVIAKVRHLFGDQLPALIITGDTDPELLVSMAAKGITVHHKPLKLDALLGAIAQLVKMRPV